MALVTENGWAQCPREQCETLLTPGTTKVRLELRAGDVATILTGWAAWWHRNVRSVEPTDGHRNWWAWSATNDVWNSNHLSGSAIDLCADELPWQRYTMDQAQISIVERGLKLFEGHVYWGGHWSRVDQMHSQMAGNTYGNPKTAEFANRLRNGYLNLFGPQDPDAFPLPAGYYYGPLDGPIESISGEYESDSQLAKDGLGRWQQTLGLEVTKRWNDGHTPQAATTLQFDKDWQPNPLFGYGGVYLGEWDAVIREGWRLPENWTPAQVPDDAMAYPLTKWVDVSQYQAAHIDDSYPYEVVCLRASIADPSAKTAARHGGMDTKWLENMRRAREMVAEGTLKKVIAYHFWVPGYDNVGCFTKAIDAAGGVFPELAVMLDVEDGGDKWMIRGDQSVGVADFVLRAQDMLVNPQGVSIYINFQANSDLLPIGSLKGQKSLRGVKLIVPRYYDPDVEPELPDGFAYFGHQYSDKEHTDPFGPCDINQAKMPLSMFLAAWGANGEVVPPTPPEPTPAPQPEPLPTPVTAGLIAIGEQFLA